MSILSHQPACGEVDGVGPHIQLRAVDDDWQTDDAEGRRPTSREKRIAALGVVHRAVRQYVKRGCGHDAIALLKVVVAGEQVQRVSILSHQPACGEVDGVGLRC